MSHTFYIVPSTKSYYDTVDAESKEDALVSFADNMTSDMAAYFEASDKAPAVYPHEYEFPDGSYETAMSIITASLVTDNTESMYYNKKLKGDKTVTIKNLAAVAKLQETYDIMREMFTDINRKSCKDAISLLETKKGFYKILTQLTGFKFDKRD